jgi:hypothetical protein
MSPLASLDVAALAAFTAAALAAACGVVFLSGFLPLGAQPEARRDAATAALLALGAALTTFLAAAAVATAAARLPLSVAVVAGGLALLAAPFLVQPLPERLRDSKAGLSAFSLAAAAAAVFLPLVNPV